MASSHADDNDRTQEPASEISPLLSHHSKSNQLDGARSNEGSVSGDDQDNPKKSSRPQRWPSILALGLLSLSCVAILVLGFALPSAIQEYALEAMVVEPKSVSIDSITPDGVVAHIRVEFMMDSHRVKRKSVRDLGRMGTWFAEEVETQATQVKALLPTYGLSLIHI